MNSLFTTHFLTTKKWFDSRIEEKFDINYQRKAKNLSVKYYLNNELIAQHLNVPLLKKNTDGPYGPTKPYIKIGIYRIGETGTTSFAYNNLIIKNKKK